MIEVHGVCKSYRRKKAADHIDFTLPEGSGIVGIIGANGSGKSTLLKLLAGLARPDKGSIRVNGANVSRRSASDIAYLSETESYYSFYTVKEMIDFYASQFPDFNRKKADDMMAFMNIDKSSRIKSLSKGSRGRVKIMLALSREASVILMDEPLSGLDPMVKESIVKGLISYIDVERQTVLLTTHELGEIEPLLDQVMLMKDGQMLAWEYTEDIRLKHGLSTVEWMKSYYENREAAYE
ncbi:ABC transporter ATP-binding protein [Sinobaca sp. H24]|uniref:ABC transporter ATP-binding protein n=1 Tax=Sinobaca sp. H24 TaxID=2923376 RepID=UPI0020798358|nr:ABC transporter ATP-binding protein [Sinobaca sp. H24]